MALGPSDLAISCEAVTRGIEKAIASFVQLAIALDPGPKACVRRRPRRVQQKIDQRAGYLHHSFGAWLHAEESK